MGTCTVTSRCYAGSLRSQMTIVVAAVAVAAAAAKKKRSSGRRRTTRGRQRNAACEAMKVKEYIKVRSGYASSFFSASWLRSSVVSVLIRLITDILSLTGPAHITICSGYVRLACQETYMCDLVLAQLRGCTPS